MCKYKEIHYSGTLVQWCTGTVVHRYNGTLVNWYNGTLVQWYSGKAVANNPVVQVLAIPLCIFQGKNKIAFYKNQVINKRY